MVKPRQIKISDAVESLNAQPIESPFGDTSLESRMNLRPKKKSPLDLLKEKRLLNITELPVEETPPKKKKKKRLDVAREVIMFPEKTNSESPKRSKLNKASKEVSAMQDKLTNIIKVPKEQLDTFMEVYNNSSKGISTQFLASIAPVFLAYEDAMNYSTVALRDGLSYDGEIDLELAPLLEWAARIATLEVYLNALTAMSDETKSRFLRLAVSRSVEKAFATKGGPAGLTGTHNKVAGIVTTLQPGSNAKNKVKKAIETVNSLKRVSETVKTEVPGVVRKRYRT
jgi:hypothetical protein